MASHQPRKRFGQNFLQNQGIINSILTQLNLSETDKLLEIGPGLGALTAPLLRRVDKLTAIEIDKNLLEPLTNLPFAKEKLNLISADALTVDYSQWGEGLRIVGNLPYNISTPLLLYLLNFAPFIKDMHFMLQKEVANRLAALPNNKNYGRLTIMVQYFCEVEYLLDVPPEAFHPQPKVDSAVIRMLPFKKSPYEAIDREQLERLVAKAFSMRRKTLANNLKPLISAAQLTDLEIDPNLRPEQISIHNYVKIANFITQTTSY